MALEQGKEVYALPGRITDPVSRGCNKLIKQGAGVILSPREFVEEICPILQLKYQRGDMEAVILLNKDEKRIIDVLDVALKPMEEIYQIIKKKHPEITMTQVMSSVLELQLKGVLKEESGYYGLNMRIATGQTGD